MVLRKLHACTMCKRGEGGFTTQRKLDALRVVLNPRSIGMVCLLIRKASSSCKVKICPLAYISLRSFCEGGRERENKRTGVDKRCQRAEGCAGVAAIGPCACVRVCVYVWDDVREYNTKNGQRRKEGNWEGEEMKAKSRVISIVRGFEGSGGGGVGVVWRSGKRRRSQGMGEEWCTQAKNCPHVQE